MRVYCVGQCRRKVREIRRRREIEVLLWGDYILSKEESRMMSQWLIIAGDPYFREPHDFRRVRSINFDSLNQHATQRLDNWFAQWRRSTNQSLEG